MSICKVLDVSPEWLLSGIDPAEVREKNHNYYVVPRDTDTGLLVSDFNKLDKSRRDRVLGYIAAVTAMK